eukprot:TRINITY_DN782124_c0_g1_i1.p1 TRINITY_DN782124_c0_g1~~TRINITY_DN782124_c0_g1_i1.p1  ORF type:complete len:205 (-),score=35.83 TRINITY_DN782124_c0_g1_i1:319-933(-)
MSRPNRALPEISEMISLLVANIDFKTRQTDLDHYFKKYGEIGDIFIPRNKRTGESRGFAFVRYYHKDEAEEARKDMDGYELDGRRISVEFAKYGREEGPSRRKPSRSYSRSRSRSYGRRRYSRSRSRSYGRRYHSRGDRGRYRRSRSPPRRRRSYSRSVSRSVSGSRSRSRSVNRNNRNRSGSRSLSRSRSVSRSRSYSRSPSN